MVVAPSFRKGKKILGEECVALAIDIRNSCEKLFALFRGGPVGEDDIDVVVEIFNRVNSGGTKLSSGDLALARISAAWPDARKSRSTMRPARSAPPAR